MAQLIIGIIFIALGTILVGVSAYDMGGPDRAELIKRYKEAGAMYDKASEVYREAIGRYPR